MTITDVKIANAMLNDSILRDMLASGMPTRDGYEFVVHVIPSQQSRNLPSGTYLRLVK